MTKQKKVELELETKVKNNYSKKFYQYFISILLVLFLTSFIIHYFLYQVKTEREIAIVAKKEANLLEMHKRDLSSMSKNVKSDLFYLANKKNIIDLFQDNKLESNILKNIREDYLIFAKNKKSYDQIRLIDLKGNELLRINYNIDTTYIVADKKLQSKSNRYYFKEAIILDKDETYVSPLDLNMEGGKIENPLKPMIRIATPFFDSNNKKQGILIFNFLADVIIKESKKLDELSYGNFMLLNSDSYWLYNQNPEKQWGFMYKNKKMTVFKASSQLAWENLKNSVSGKVIDPDKNTLYIYDTITHYEQLNTSINSYYWKLVSKISLNEITSSYYDLFTKSFIITSIFIIIISILFPMWLVNRSKSIDIEIELKQKDSILAMIVTTNHEINQPLTVVQGNLQMIEMTINENNLTDNQKKYFVNINMSLKKINKILQKYRNSKLFHFDKYVGDTDMIIFEEENDDISS